MYSNGNSFGASVGNAADLGSAGTCVHGFPGDGTLPASARGGAFAAWPVWRI